jgi:hypothetical protein
MKPGAGTEVLAKYFVMSIYKHGGSNDWRSQLESSQVYCPMKWECLIEFYPSPNNRIYIEFNSIKRHLQLI